MHEWMRTRVVRRAFACLGYQIKIKVSSWKSQTFIFTVLAATMWKLRCRWEHILRTLEENWSLPLSCFWCLSAILGIDLSVVSGWKPTLIQIDFTLAFTSAQTLFSNKVIFIGTRCYVLNIPLLWTWFIVTEDYDEICIEDMSPQCVCVCVCVCVYVRIGESGNDFLEKLKLNWELKNG
jgi:hypothetical protein